MSAGWPEAPQFREPWEARAFALAVRLHERGVFTWREWTEALGAEIARAGAAPGDRGEHYYRHWLAALERLTREKRVVGVAELAERRAAWARAVRATPHGKPILLANDPGA